MTRLLSLFFGKGRELRGLLLLAAILLFATLKEPRMLEPQSISSILLWIPLLAVVALGEMLVVLTRGIDVSVGSILGLTGMAVGQLFRMEGSFDPYLACLAGAAVGGLLGSVNGLLVVGAGVPAIVATLGTMTAFRGLAFIVSKGEQVNSNDIPDELARWSVDGPVRIGGVTLTWALAAAVLLLLFGHLALSRLKKGRWLLATGGNVEAARLSGVPVRRLSFFAFVLCGVLAGLGGMFYASRFNVVNPATAGQGFELTVIAAVVIGGTSILGGSGSVPGVLIGCVLLATINVALSVLGIAATWQLAAYGAVILVAVLAERAFRKEEAIRN
jgi:rhamnose transport system permease protein